MECTARILKEIKVFNESEGNPTYVKIYCPIMGEVFLSGEDAVSAIKRLEEIKSEILTSAGVAQRKSG